ncbi:MAG: hypothetical protein R3B09_30315 [Nannocystaceae bacterium]
MRLRSSLVLLAALAAAPLEACRCREEPVVPPPDPGPREAGERVPIPGATVSLLVPERWKHELEDDVLSLIGPEARVILTVMTVDAAGLDASLSVLDRELRRVVRGVALRELRDLQVDEMPALVGEGEGRLDGERVDLCVLLVRVPGRKVVILFGVALPDTEDADTQAILGSLRRL